MESESKLQLCCFNARPIPEPIQTQMPKFNGVDLNDLAKKVKQDIQLTCQIRKWGIRGKDCGRKGLGRKNVRVSLCVCSVCVCVCVCVLMSLCVLCCAVL